ncbi:spore coat protein [Paenibacillus filicis]|uniref:Spore coat protein n=1 Tax=Paenibacillus gyeongsangnamensis TaxID=3388067 RepID=A0ABT4QDT2_9BACL|nr:spore coat protein [Paenibacillus filicis]MCZ8514942.1 spore coat protein [Paenibacillus filicis]
MYQQTNYGSTQASGMQHTHLGEQDWGNLVLSELKRTAREYTTASLEASHPAIRQTFASLIQKTLQDQAELFSLLSQMNGYGNVQMAQPQEIQQDLQQQVRRAEQLQAFVQQAVQSGYAGAAAYQQTAQQVQQQQQPAYQQQSVYPQQPSFPSAQVGYMSQGQSSSPGFQSPYASQSFSPGTAGTTSGYASSSAYSQNQAGSTQQDAADAQDFAARASQDYVSNKYSSGSQSSQESSYSSSLGTSGTARSGYHFTGSSSDSAAAGAGPSSMQ